MSQTITRTECPGCGREIALRPESGTFRTHGPIGDRCPGSWRTPHDEPAPRDPDTSELLRRYWRIGDAFAASKLTGIPYPAPEIPEGLSLDLELAYLINHAREFIAQVASFLGDVQKPIHRQDQP